jgi:hypothetical protein
MEVVTLTNQNEFGQNLVAKFCPNKGMNLMSYSKDHLEIFDQRTKMLFDERCAGLGALIGPHFHHRADSAINKGFDENIFPYIAALKAKGQKEYFSHGIARYVPWKYKASTTQIDAWLSGTDKYQGVMIREFEGQDFEMHMHAALIHDGLLIDLSIHSDRPSLVGFHYYYALQQDSILEAYVHDHYRDASGWKPIPTKWYDPSKKKLHFDLNQESDYGFQSFLHNNHPFHRINVKSESSILHVEYTSSNENETSWQLYHPKNESFVCIEPLSAKDPRSPHLNSSNLQLKLNTFEIN